jgi:hypothetical protein
VAGILLVVGVILWALTRFANKALGAETSDSDSGVPR